jgi:O-glycosyl hydrolase
MKKKYMITDILASALAALLMACGSSSESGGDTPNPTPNTPSVSKVVASLLTSTANKAYDLKGDTAEITKGSTMATTVLQLDPTKTYQTMDGFGFALTYSSCYNLMKMSAADFEKNNIKTKIYVFDHNYNYDNVSDQNDYPIKVYNALGSSFDGSELVVGAAYHDYGGSNTELDDIHQQAPTKDLIFSETSIGTWNDGRNLSTRLVADMKSVLLGTVNRYCKAVLVWNLMLDDKLGPNLDGGCQTCYGAVDISNSYKTISRNSHYYIITHAAEAVETGAQRIGTSRDPRLTGITHAEFLNPDGTYGLLLLNEGTEDQTMTVSDGSQHFKVTVPASGVVSCKWKKL